MTNLDPFLLILVSALFGVIVSRAVARHELKAIEVKHQANKQNIQWLHLGEIEALKAKNDRHVLTVLKAAYEAGMKDPSAKKACKCRTAK